MLNSSQKHVIQKPRLSAFRQTLSHHAMVKAWLRATAALSAALALQGALRGRLSRAAAAAGLTALLLAWSAKPQRCRVRPRPQSYPKQYVARTWGWSRGTFRWATPIAGWFISGKIPLKLG